MTKVHILIECSHCNGQAYLPAGEAESYTGELYMRYVPCTHCQGTGHKARWISLREFADLLLTEVSSEPVLQTHEQIALPATEQ